MQNKKMPEIVSVGYVKSLFTSEIDRKICENPTFSFIHAVKQNFLSVAVFPRNSFPAYFCKKA